MESLNSKTMELAKAELLEDHQERNSLMRWKLILVSAIGAAALGFSQESPLPQAEPALCLIPFTCVYVDILCRNLSIRTKMISAFLARQNDPLESFYQEYQKYKEAQGGSSLESLALRYSTVFLSLIVIPIGIISYFGNPSELSTWLNWTSVLFYFSGLSGVVLSFVVEKQYQKQKKVLSSLKDSTAITKGS